MDEKDIGVIVSEFERSRRGYKDFTERLEDLLRDICGTAGVKPALIQTRVKPAFSLANKLRKKPHLDSLTKVSDLCGARVILVYKSEVARVRDAICAEFHVIEEQMHGRTRPDSFGYESLHLRIGLQEPRTLLPEWRNHRDKTAEVQIRTILQHAWAEISHKHNYKNPLGLPEDANRQLSRGAALLEAADESFDQFRLDVQRLREASERESVPDFWRDWPCTTKSLVAGWNHLDWDRVARFGQAAGLPPREDIPAVAEESYRSIFATDLAEVARAAGITSLGALADAIEDVVLTDSNRLTRFAMLATDLGFTPPADPLHIVVYALVLQDAALVKTVAGLSFVEPIIEALERLAGE